MQRIGYRDAVARQPDCLSTGIKAVRETLKAFDPIPFASRSIGFAGIGASFQAAMIGATYARSLGLRSYAYCPTDLYDERADGAEAFVALSASGQSQEIADVMACDNSFPVSRYAEEPTTPWRRSRARLLPPIREPTTAQVRPAIPAC